MRPVVFADQMFRYLRCSACHSLVCDPMPDEAVLAAMYGPGYAALTAGDYEIDSPRDAAHVIGFLQSRPPGTIIDFGCGSGDLIRAIQRETSWTPIGIEFDRRVADEVRDSSGADVFTYADIMDRTPAPVDALHLGDVLEHLTDLEQQMPDLLRLLRPGGRLLAEGPLQCGPAVFELVIQMVQVARRSRPVAAPPTHVLQASAAGQRAFFSRHGLSEIDFTVYEVAWPAPSRLRAVDFGHPRTVALFALRQLSRPMSRRILWGNRYRYIGFVS